MMGLRITRRDLLRGMGGLVAASCFSEFPKLTAMASQGRKVTREFNIKGYNRVLLPRGHGQLTYLSKTIVRRYPSRDHCMQMAAFFSDRSGLLIHTKDSNGYISDWEIIPGDKLRVHSYHGEVDCEVKSIRPSIEEAGIAYGEWAREQTWGSQRVRPPFNFSLIAVASNPNLVGQLANLKLLAERYAGPIGAWITQWRRYEFDAMYPDYEPRNPNAFSDLLDGLNAIHCTAFPYINALLWDRRHRSFDRGKAVALRNSDGSMLPYSRKLPWLMYACPAYDVWQDIIISAREKLTDSMGKMSSGVYLDMLLAAGPFLCFASHHGHAPGDPLAWQNGVRKILASIQGLIISEGNAEIYIDKVDALLMHLFTDRSDIVPLWRYVYGDVAASVGWQMPENITPKELLRELTRSRQFGVACHGSPWMTHVIQEKLLKPDFKEALTEILAAHTP